MREWIKFMLCGATVFALASAAFAADNIVSQRHRNFSTGIVTVRRGEPVLFVNDDTVPHNIMSNSANNGFDLGSQMPGVAIPVSFSQTGTVAVICAIHPRMHMTIHVVD